MKVILVVTMIAFTLNANSQKLVKEYYDWAKTKIMKEYYTDAYGTMNGTFKAYSEYGGIMKQGQCKDDRPIGKWIENYWDGKLHYVKYYDSPGTNDFKVINGKIISYYEDGKTIEYERNFKDMELDGVWKEYDEKGIITKEGKYVNGVFEPTGITKIKYDEEQEKEKQRQALLLMENKEKYDKIIPDADKAYVEKDYLKALKLYQSATALLKDEKYPKEKILNILETYQSNKKFFEDYMKSQHDSLVSDFNLTKQSFRMKSIKVYNQYTYKYEDKVPQGGGYPSCDCKSPWNEVYYPTIEFCFEKNKEFYEPYHIVITKTFHEFQKVIENEEGNIRNTGTNINISNTNYWIYTYEKDKFLSAISNAKLKYNQAKSMMTLALKVEEKSKQIDSLNSIKKKKVLFRYYTAVKNDFQTKLNSNLTIEESILKLNESILFFDKIIALYSVETKELEKQLKATTSVEQIITLIVQFK